MTDHSILADCIARYPALEACEADILKACDALEAAFRNGKKLLIAGNGGSAADADHMAAELLKNI